MKGLRLALMIALALSLAGVEAGFAAAAGAAGERGAVEEKIVFASLDDARRDAAARGVPLVVSFTAPWCGWCRKMDAETWTDARLVARGGEFVWAKVDTDAEPAVAAQHRVRGLPHTAVLDSGGERLASRAGFMSAERTLRFLDEALEARAGAAPPQLPRDAQAAAAALLESLASPERAGRQAALRAAARLGPEAWPALAAALDDPRLAYRAAAGQALALATGADLPFDPFVDGPARAKQAVAWRAWVEREVGASPVERPAEPEAPRPVEAP